MTEPPSRAVLDWDGPLSPPRSSGEIKFETVWESRLFGMTMALYEAGAFRWQEFRDQLIAAIAAWEHAHHSSAVEYRYWDRWLEAFERLVADKGLCPANALHERVETLAARPAGHDHEPR
jgi:nitrile hydratase accessory protein